MSAIVSLRSRYRADVGFPFTAVQMRMQEVPLPNKIIIIFIVYSGEPFCYTGWNRFTGVVLLFPMANLHLAEKYF
jgi:hypothetical protein